MHCMQKHLFDTTQPLERKYAKPYFDYTSFAKKYVVQIEFIGRCLDYIHKNGRTWYLGSNVAFNRVLRLHGSWINRPIPMSPKKTNSHKFDQLARKTKSLITFSPKLNPIISYNHRSTHPKQLASSPKFYTSSPNSIYNWFLYVLRKY